MATICRMTVHTLEEFDMMIESFSKTVLSTVAFGEYDPEESVVTATAVVTTEIIIHGINMVTTEEALKIFRAKLDTKGIPNFNGHLELVAAQ